MVSSSSDLSGGLALEQDLVFGEQPTDPEMRESVSVWIYADDGSFGFPRMGIEAEGSCWNDRRFQAAFTTPDGRVLDSAGRGPAPSPFDGSGRPTILGGGPLTFKCIKPFKQWTLRYDGSPVDGTTQETIEGNFGHRGSTQVSLEVDMKMVTPAWVQETRLDSSMSEIERQNALAMGVGYRFEHHFRCTGQVQLDGRTHRFTGTGTRIHRQSIRQMVGFFGHCWLSAVFPDGSAFGSLVYPPRAGSDEDFSYNDAVIYKDGILHQARVIRAPILHRIMSGSEQFELELASKLGRTVIEGTTTMSRFRIGNPDIGGLNLQQGGALFRWGDQKAYGMVERSTHESQTIIC